MMKINFRKLGKVANAFLVKHSADILTGFTAAGVVLTAFETHKATLRAEEYLRVNGYDKANPDTQKVLKLNAAKNYLVPAAIGLGTISAAVGANYINHKQIAGLAAACSVAETALSEHRDKVQELLGDKALAQVDDGLMQDKMERVMATETAIIDTGHGHTLCIDGLTGQKMWASPEWFYACLNRFNSDVNQTTYASVADWLDYLYQDSKDRYYVPRWAYERGYNVHSNGIMDFKTPHWEGGADTEPYVIFEPVRDPIANYSEIL